MNYQNQQQSPNTVGNFFKAMKILFGAFILGMINFGIVILILFFLDLLPIASLPEGYQLYLILGNLAALVVMFFATHNIYVSKLKKAKEQTTLGKKITEYRVAKLIQISIAEGVGLLSLVFLMLNTHFAFLIFSAITLIHMVRLYPQKQKMISDLELNYSDQQHLDNPEYLLD